MPLETQNVVEYGKTKRMQECVLFIQSYIEKYGFSPSYTEIADAMGLKSKAGVHRLIKSLVERGLAVRIPNRKRSVVINVPTGTMGSMVSPPLGSQGGDAPEG